MQRRRAAPRVSAKPLVPINAVVFSCRSPNERYRRIDNPLFYMDKTMMVFGDAKNSSRTSSSRSSSAFVY